MSVKMGYFNAYEHLKLVAYKKMKTKKEQDLSNDALHDFDYCIKMTQRMEKILEAEELRKEALDEK
jgi:hypothetical protein